ncbi:ATP-dependent DNA helicase [Trichonephila clavata]|uniref:ATP-dependent DNA helicase n=1 Tax=Trichonephila clavata TaxID=2740835 RepID=A0A8X6LED5_TRICU|nr:ATP-dependent DNA helicase [Trichonephila clavata]
MVVNFKTKKHIAVLHAKPGSSNNDIYDALDQILDNKNSDYRTVLAGDFKIKRMTRRGREFCEMLTNMYYITLRNNPSQYTTIGQTTIDCVFSTYGLRTWGVFESGLSTHLPLHVQMPWEKKKVRTSYPQEDDDPSLECGPDLLDRTGEIDWAEDDDFAN